MEREFQKENGQTDHHQIYELDTIKHKRMKSVEKKHTEDKVEVRCAHRSRCDSRQFSPLWTFLAFLQNDPVFFCFVFLPALHGNMTSRHLNAPIGGGIIQTPLFLLLLLL